MREIGVIKIATYIESDFCDRIEKLFHRRVILGTYEE